MISSRIQTFQSHIGTFSITPPSDFRSVHRSIFLSHLNTEQLELLLLLKLVTYFYSYVREFLGDEQTLFQCQDLIYNLVVLLIL